MGSVSKLNRAIEVARVRELLTNRVSSYRGFVLWTLHIVCVCDCAKHTVAISGCVLLSYMIFEIGIHVYCNPCVHKGCTMMSSFSLGPSKSYLRSSFSSFFSKISNTLFLSFLQEDGSPSSGKKAAPYVVFRAITYLGFRSRHIILRLLQTQLVVDSAKSTAEESQLPHVPLPMYWTGLCMRQLT